MPGKTMFVRNNLPGPTVLDEEGHEMFQWKGLGSPDGGDVLPMPSDLAESYNFQRARMLGIIDVIEAPDDVQLELDRSRDAWQRQMERKAQLSTASLGQLPAEEGSVAREFTADKVVKPQSGPGEIPKTMENIVGVTFEDDQAIPKIKQARVVMGPRGTYF